MIKHYERMKFQRPDQGLTLLEILVSSLILVIVAAASYSAYSAMNAVVRARADQLQAVDLARNQITKLKKLYLVDGALPTSLEGLECSNIPSGVSCSLSGFNGTPNSKLDRLVYSTSIDHAKMITRLYRNDGTSVVSSDKASQVSVAVLWRDVRGNEKSEALTTYFYKP